MSSNIGYHLQRAAREYSFFWRKWTESEMNLARRQAQVFAQSLLALPRSEAFQRFRDRSSMVAPETAYSDLLDYALFLMHEEDYENNPRNDGANYLCGTYLGDNGEFFEHVITDPMTLSWIDRIDWLVTDWAYKAIYH